MFGRHLGFLRQRKVGEGKKFLPRGWSIGDRRKGRGGGGGEEKNTPAWGHCSFRKLRSPTNGVSDWCGLGWCPSIACQSPAKLVRACGKKTMKEKKWYALLKVMTIVSICSRESFSVFIWTWNVSRVTCRENRHNFHAVIRKRSAGTAANWLWEKLKLIFSSVV